MRERKKYDDEMQNRFHALLETKHAILQKEPPEGIDEKLRRSCFEQVKQELPPDNFFVPEE